MAFIRDPNENNRGQGGGNILYSPGQSGVAGQMGLNAGTAQPSSASKAASPSSWYNIREFLTANQSAIPQYQQNLRSLAQTEIGKDKTKAQESIAAMQGINRPEAQLYNKDNAWTGSQDFISGGLGQEFQAPDYSQWNINPNQNIQKLKEGSRQSILDFNKTYMPGRANYTGGMERMDDLLLGSDPNFVSGFAGGVKEQYKSDVTDPFQTQITASQAEDLAAKQKLDEARGGWWSGLTDLLGEKNKAVQDTLAQQQTQYNQIYGQTPQEALAAEINRLGRPEEKSWLTGKTYFSLDDFLRGGAGNYARPTGFAPDAQTAAYLALGGEQGLGQYNMIEDIMNQKGYEQNRDPDQFSQLAGREYQAPSWDVEGKNAIGQYQRMAAEAEAEALRPKYKQYQSEVANTQKSYDDLMSEFKTSGDNESRYRQDREQAQQALANAKQAGDAVNIGHATRLINDLNQKIRDERNWQEKNSNKKYELAQAIRKPQAYVSKYDKRFKELKKLMG